MQIYFYNSKELVNSKHPVWNYPMPLSRQNADIYRESSSVKKNDWISYGDYFESVFHTLKYNNFELLLSLITKKFKNSVSISSVEYLSIDLKKHGAFYHPSKLEVSVCGYSLFFVVNVAISEIGKMTIAEETKSLNLLGNIIPLNFLPKIYEFSSYNPIKLPMFFGEWFSDFHEFHLSIDHKTRKNRIIVWDSSQNNQFLTDYQTKQLYYQVAMVLSLYYDPISTNQISSWHNASGDFVINTSGNFLQTHLISTRGFKPMFQTRNLALDFIFYALMIFLLRISLHIRLDRLDGTGKLVLGHNDYTYYVLKGFFQGICLSVTARSYPNKLIKIFKNYLLSYSRNNLLDLGVEVVNKVYENRTDERLIIISELDEHIKTLFDILPFLKEEKV